MATSTTQSTRIDVLNKTNYDTWCIHVEALLCECDLWGYVTGEIEKPAAGGANADAIAARQVEINTWTTQDRRAKGKIVLSIGPGQLHLIKNCATSKDVWDKLKGNFVSQGPMRKANLLEKLLMEKMHENDCVRDHLSRFMDTVDKLKAMDIEINGDLLSIMLLHSLPPSFETFCCAIKSRDALPHIDALTTKIIEDHESRLLKAGDSGADAMYARPKGYNPKKTSSNNKGQQKQAQGNQQNQGNSSSQKPRCSYCKKRNHTIDICRKKKADEQLDNNAALMFYMSEDDCANSTTANGDVSDSKWCLDSGCTSHLCKDSDAFINTTQFKSGVRMASNATAAVTSKGDVRMTATDGIDEKPVVLQNALYVPELRTNLMSVAKIVDKNHTVLFTAKSAVIRDLDGKVKMVAERQGNLFFVRQADNQACATSHEAPDRVTDWHRRLGHLNWQDMQQMAKDGSVTGLDLRSGDKLPPCTTCAAAKITVLPFHERERQANALLEVVHSDVCGPTRVASRGGARYFVTFTDEFSRWTEVYFMRNKSEVPEKFIEYKNMAENQTGAKIKALQSDNGGEYCNSKLDDVLRKAGIKRRLTAPHTPQQNGISERKNRTLVESARCMLAESGLPQQFWAEAISMANHVRNRCITKVLKTRTPYELWTGRKPDVKHLHHFGAKVFYLDKSINRNKLSPKGIEGMLIGFSDTAKAYRIWNPEDKKVYISRDVRFFPDVNEAESREIIIEDVPLAPAEATLPRSPVEGSDHRGKPPPTGQTLPESNNPRRETDDQSSPARAPVQDVRRGRGRPSKVKTGKRGRPAKKYCTVPVEPTPEESASDEEDDPNGFPSSDLGCVAMNADEIPFLEATTGSDKSEWEDAIYLETRSLVSNDTFQIVNRPQDQRVIKCRTVLRNKHNAAGEITRRKARVVAKGCSQRPGVDYFDTFAPVARLGSLRVLVALAAKTGMKISQLDVECAYLHGDIDTDIYMELPDLLRPMLERIIQQEGDSPISRKARALLKSLDVDDPVCKLEKALYGLRQAGRQWYLTLTRSFKEVGLTPTASDPCVFVDSKRRTYVLIYVDDILLFSNDSSMQSRIKQKLASSFKMKDLGDAKYCLGIEIHRGENEISLSQKGASCSH